MSETIEEIRADSRYLHGDDLKRGHTWSEFSLTVTDVGVKDSAKDQRGKKIPGYPVRFEESDKVLVMRTVNTKLASSAMGSVRRADWVGKKLTVYPAMLNECFGQRNIVCLRVRVPEGVARPFIQPKHLGKDITGNPVVPGYTSSREIEQPEPETATQPHVSMPDAIRSAETVSELESLMPQIDDADLDTVGAYNDRHNELSAKESGGLF